MDSEKDLSRLLQESTNLLSTATLYSIGVEMSCFLCPLLATKTIRTIARNGITQNDHHQQRGFQ